MFATIGSPRPARARHEGFRSDINRAQPGAARRYSGAGRLSGGPARRAGCESATSSQAASGAAEDGPLGHVAIEILDLRQHHDRRTARLNPFVAFLTERP
jgi:hypothetical protein